MSSFLLGALAAPVHPAATPAILAAAVGFFLLRNPLLRWPRGGSFLKLDLFPWPGWLFCASLVGFGALPLIWLHRWALVGAAFVALAALIVESQCPKSNPRSRMISEVLNSLVAALLAPAAVYASTGRLGWKELTLWILCGVYFGLTTIDVRWRIITLYHRQGLASAERAHQASRERTTAMAVGFILAMLYWMLAPVAWIVLLAFLPLAYRLCRPTAVSAPLSQVIRRLGWQEVRLSLLFVFLSAALVRLH